MKITLKRITERLPANQTARRVMDTKFINIVDERFPRTDPQHRLCALRIERLSNYTLDEWVEMVQQEIARTEDQKRRNRERNRQLELTGQDEERWNDIGTIGSRVKWTTWD